MRNFPGHPGLGTINTTGLPKGDAEGLIYPFARRSSKISRHCFISAGANLGPSLWGVCPA
eukprot:1158827-Prorocentrum_minimum.AAC.1